MSRVGKKPIAVPSGVDFSVKDNVVTVKGPKGTLTKEFNNNITIFKIITYYVAIYIIKIIFH